MYFDPKQKGRQTRGAYKNRSAKGKKNRTDSTRKPKNRNQDLVDIFKDTERYCQVNLKHDKRGENYLLTIKEIDENFKSVDLSILPTYENNVIVRNEGSLQGAAGLVDCKTLVLNFASDYMPGGGVRKGSRAQEEDLFRKTSYSMYLNLKNRKEFYPLSENQMIETIGVKVIRGDDHRFLPEDEQFYVDFLALPAIRRPATFVDEKGRERYDSRKDYDLMRRKIESIFKLGILDGHEALVLGALGCGAFRNPPYDVKHIFEKTLDKYGKYFKIVRFAVLAGTATNINFDLFKTMATRSL